MDEECKNCEKLIRKIPFLGGEEWMHVNPHAGFPSTSKGTLWRYCKIQVAEPKDK